MQHSIEKQEHVRRPANAGPRAILRVFEVLSAIAGNPRGKTSAELRGALSLPKSSMHRFLRTLELEGYVVNRSGIYSLGPESRRFASLISQALPVEEFPISIQPIMDWLARESGDTVFVGKLTDDLTEVVYFIVVNSQAPLRFTIPVGVRRPLYCVASGKAILAFSSPAFWETYLEKASFQRFTEFTTTRDQLPAVIEEVRIKAVAFDKDGSILGASAVASPAFDMNGEVAYSISIAGPTERIENDRERLETMIRTAGERMSRILGYTGAYPATV